jgi:indole-3-glycerol phosphate synthase/phosphoribosylanthranilate isomerase/anthranilate synthase/indole-3-glycerol phosphate synthase/phosphoribosylanthranilate isomerase
MPDESGKTILDNIISTRRRTLEETRIAVPLERVQEMAAAREERRDFAAALAPSADPGAPRVLRVIAELKRASPSRGLLRQHYRRREIAAAYAAGGAAALSVLTEEHYFLGSTQDLAEVRQAVEIPLLRKDFILESYQVYESVAAGADALLLIVTVLPEQDLRSLIELSKQLRIAALVEVHTETELDRALAAGARIIGVNNRDLNTLEVKLETSFELRAKIPSGCLAVSESGIKTPADLRLIREAGFDAVLIGERLMTQKDPGQALQKLLADLAGEPAPLEAPSLKLPEHRPLDVVPKPSPTPRFEFQFSTFERMPTRVKVCGITRREDAQLAVELGATALGFNFYPPSPRYIDPATARAIIQKLPPFITAVGIFADTLDDALVARVARQARVTAVQLHGPKFPPLQGALADFVRIRAVAVEEGFKPEMLRNLASDAFLLDAFDPTLLGGTGKSFNWILAREANRFGTIILAGGLTPENVGQAIREARPFAVDVASGVEAAPGVKDAGKLRAFFREVERAHRSLSDGV